MQITSAIFVIFDLFYFKYIYLPSNSLMAAYLAQAL